jgi:hypothetical protein
MTDQPFATESDGFTPTGPRQPLPGVLWPVEEWVSFGADAWDLDHRCVVCGGDLAGFDHARCWPSMDAVPPGGFPFSGAVPRNSDVSAESVESESSAFGWECARCSASGSVSPASSDATAAGLFAAVDRAHRSASPSCRSLVGELNVWIADPTPPKPPSAP